MMIFQMIKLIKWNGKGKTLLESLDELKPVKRDFDSQLIISIFKAYTIMGVGIIIRGKILSGKLTKQQNLYLNFKYRIELGEINSFQMYDKKLDVAVAGDIISLHIKHIIYTEAKVCNLDMSNRIIHLVYYPKKSRLHETAVYQNSSKKFVH